MGEIPHDWFDGLFESEWLDYLALGQSAEWTDQTIAFLVEQLDLHELDAVAAYDVVLNLFTSFGLGDGNRIILRARKPA
jgi:hypothetical protein